MSTGGTCEDVLEARRGREKGGRFFRSFDSAALEGKERE